MAVEDIREYYERVVSDYTEMKRVLNELENIKEENIKTAYVNIDDIRDKVHILESNYKRLSYIIYLLNMPKKKKKRARYSKSESNKLVNIHEKDRMSGVLKENSDIINNLKSYL